jgi:hypothetical protein
MKFLLFSLLAAMAVSASAQHAAPVLKDVTIRPNFVYLTWTHPYAYEFEIRTAVPHMERPTFIKMDQTKLFHMERSKGVTTFTEKVKSIAQEFTVSVRAVFGTNVTEFSNPIAVVLSPETNPGHSRNNMITPIPSIIIPPLTP